MGPQPSSRGNLFGGDYNVEGIELQWGRNLPVAEISRGDTGLSQLPRFNGAATFQSRKFRVGEADAGAARPRFNGAATFQSRK